MTSSPQRFNVVAANHDVSVAIGKLRGRERTSFDAVKSHLEAQGCRQAGYRLLDANGEPSGYCSKHLYGSLRLITTFETTQVIVVALGHHDGDSFYRELAQSMGTSAVGQKRDEKPPCCGSEGWLEV